MRLNGRTAFPAGARFLPFPATGTVARLSMDPDALGTSVTDTITYCGENQEMSVLNAATEVSAN